MVLFATIDASASAFTWRQENIVWCTFCLKKFLAHFHLKKKSTAQHEGKKVSREANSIDEINRK